MKQAAILLLAAATLRGEGVTPKPAATDYPAHTAVSTLSIGAEYLVRSLPVQGRTFVLSDYLVVEVGIYSSGPDPVEVSSGHFTLRLNKKDVLAPETPGFVAAALKYPDWEYRPRLEAAGGVGDIGVILGRPADVERFPGDPRPGRTRLPAPTKAPAPEDRSGVEKPPPLRADEAVVSSALPHGPLKLPVGGYLYFHHKGKTKSIRALELLYQGPAGTATLRLF